MRGYPISVVEHYGGGRGGAESQLEIIAATSLDRSRKVRQRVLTQMPKLQGREKSF